MKPDGATMETTELGEAAAVAERSSQENINEEAQIQPEAAAPAETQKANGKPLAVDPKVKPKAAGSKIQPTFCAGAAGSTSRPGTASHRTERDIKSSSAGRKAAAAAAGGVAASKPSAAGAVPKRPVGVPAVSSTAKNQSRALDRKPVGPVKTADATVTNGTKLRVPPNGISRKPAAEAANGARPKTTVATNRPVASAAPKTNASTTTKPVAPASSRTRLAAGPSTSRATSTFSKPAAAATTKISTTVTSRVASSRATAAPSAGRSAGAQLNKNPANKDISRPPSAAAAKKPLPTTPSASPVAKKKERSRTTTTVKPNSAPTATKAAEPKALLGKVKSVAKPTQAKKPAATVRFPPSTRPPLGQTPPCSPAGGPLTPAAKRGTNKPTQTVSPFAQKAAKVALPFAKPQIAAPPATAAESVQVADTVTEVTTAAVVSAVEKVQTQVQRDAEPEEVAQPINTTSPPTSPPFRGQSEDRAAPLPEPEQLSSSAKPSSPTVASSSARLPQEADQTASTPAVNPTEPSTTAQTEAAIINLNEEEDEEEREGSQLVSVSEMSGTTQPTEESRPGSGGPVGRAAWKAGGALLSELDSEDVSGSQQGASELSAPGVLEGTESTDDLGDGSLKGAIDIELASVGSPDFEKVPDIPANEDEDEDDSDRVCDMEVGSEWTDEPRRPRHDNDVDEDEDDDDVEMASEGVTESGLESYGNADEDDFAEDNLDNLNRVLQPLPPPPVLPSAPAAQWDQPNPFASPWEEPPQSHIPGESKASANCDALVQSAAQTWLDVGSAPSALEQQDVCHHSSLPNEPQNVEPAGPAPETALPGDQGDRKQEGKLPAHVFETSAHSSQPDGDCQDAQAERGEQQEEEEEEEAEPETLPADEVLGGPSTAPTSNPSSSSVTEDEASDTEGEAQLDESLKCPPVSNLTFDMQSPLPQRCLSTVEEGEEVESFLADEATPPSAASLASYNFDSVTTASNSNAQSTGESCIKSPGIFSLEELSEEAKEPCLNPEPDAQRCAAEYIECGKQQEAEAAERVETELPGSEDATAKPEEIAEDIQPPYYSTICEKTEDSFTGFAAIPHPHRRDHSSYPRTFCDLVKPVISAAASPKLTCTDLPPRSLGQQALSPQLRRLEQHQRQLLELQQRRAQQSRPLEEAEQERKRRVEEEQRKKKDEAEEEIKRNKADVKRRKKEEEEELQQRRGLERQLQQQQQELQQRQQIMQWQQELQQSNKSQTALLSPSSGLCTIYEALESSEDEETPEQNPDSDPTQPEPDPHQQMCPSCDSDRPSPERPPPLDLDWGKKVDIVQQLINQTLLLNGDGCSSLLLLPGGAGGTLSPLESSLWPSLLPPLTPQSATVTSVSSFSPEATGSSPQGEWTVVELETHH